MTAALLAGKAALVTGSTSGIGLAMARALAGAGANVALHGFGDASQIQQLRDELSKEHDVDIAYSDADLRKPPLIRDMVKEVHQQFGRLDILVNNAGEHTRPHGRTADTTVCLTGAQEAAGRIDRHFSVCSSCSSRSNGQPVLSRKFCTCLEGPPIFLHQTTTLQS